MIDLCHLQAWKIDKVCYERDTEAYSVSRDKAMNAAIEATGTHIHSFVSHTLYVSLQPAVLYSQTCYSLTTLPQFVTYILFLSYDPALLYCQTHSFIILLHFVTCLLFL